MLKVFSTEKNNYILKLLQNLRHERVFYYHSYDSSGGGNKINNETFPVLAAIVDIDFQRMCITNIYCNNR